MNHFIRISDLGPEGVASVLDQAANWKLSAPGPHLQDAVLGMLFFNPSLRTRVSFELAMIRGGGHAISLEVGGGTWRLETREGVVMDGDRTEHLKEAIPVLGRYCNLLGVRAFSAGESDDEDHQEPTLELIRKYSTVPVVSMEGAREHPCQGLADMLTLKERFGDLRGLPVTLCWAPHVKPLPKAVPNSFLLTAAACGCNVRVAHPEGFDLHANVLEEADRYAQQAGGSVCFFDRPEEGLDQSAAVCIKAWGPSSAHAHLNPRKDEWRLNQSHIDLMQSNAAILHCLPVRRGLEVADALLDSAQCAILDEAENRFHVQRVILDRLHNGKEKEL